MQMCYDHQGKLQKAKLLSGLFTGSAHRILSINMETANFRGKVYIHFMTSACDLVYWYILMIRRFLVIKHLKREKALRPLDGWRCKSKWHAYDINQDAEHKPIIHFCLIWFGQFLLFLQIYKRRCAKRCVWFISRYPLIAIWTT